MDFPLDIKYRARRLNNYRPYILGGINFRYDLATNKMSSDTSSLNNEKKELMFNPGDIYFEIGVGIDYYLPYFKFATELKLGIGMTDIIRRKEFIYNQKLNFVGNENYLASIQRMNAIIVSLSFHFE